MSRIRTWTAGAACLAVVLQVSPLWAAEGGEWFPSDGPRGDFWSDVDIVMDTNVYGFVPATVVSDDSDAPVRVKELLRLQSEIRGRLKICGKYLEGEFEPYTTVPTKGQDEQGYRVSTTGLEAYVLMPVWRNVRLGLYHHSSHNFSDGTYGTGIDLNAWVVDAEFWRDVIPYLAAGRYRLRLLGMYYLTTRASPHVLTKETEVMASQIGHTKWQVGLKLDVRHPALLSECDVRTLGAPRGAASIRGDCAVTVQAGNRVFGAFGEHLYVGPYLQYGHNVTRTGEFGTAALAAGLRLNLLTALP